MAGDSISDAVGDTDPGDIPLPAQLLPCLAKSAGGEFTAAKIDRFIAIAHSRLQSHPVNAARLLKGQLPANGIITRGAGAWFNVNNVFQQNDIKASVVAGCNTVTGLGKMFGFEVEDDPRFTATVDTDLDAKMEAAVRALEHHDIVYIHVKAPDICAHDFQPGKKRDVLARLDRTLQVLEKAGCVIALSADHSTDSNTGFHTADPVPALIYNPLFESRSDPVNFGESACREGNMPRQNGSQFLQEVVRTMGW
jgi:2,3-bisphosphoglycerate-independent phosphoglycerate mutase